MALATLRQFRDDRHGVFAVMFALALFPTMLIVGGAIDYSMAVKKKTQLQRALDAGVLATATKGTPDVDHMKRYLEANLASQNVTVANATLTQAPGAGGNVAYTGAANFQAPTHFLKMIGIANIPIGAQSEARLPRWLRRPFRQSTRRALLRKTFSSGRRTPQAP